MPPAPHTRPARLALTGIIGSLVLLAALGLLGPSWVVPYLRSAAPWPPYFLKYHPRPGTVSCLAWLAVLLGAVGLIAGLIAVRRGWRPWRLLLAGSVVAVLLFLLLPPIGSTDMLDYASYGRIAALGHDPYQMTPAQLRRTGDPVGRVAPRAWEHVPSVYGPLATASELAASKLAGTSAARTVFWLKLWNALAFLAVVLALDRSCRSDPARRSRVHLLWSANPLMLLAVMAGGHVDGIGAACGVLALLAFRKPGFRPALLAGALAGLATAVKAPFALFGLGLAISAIRSPRELAGLAAGGAAIVLPSYLLAGQRAIQTVTRTAARAATPYEPWGALYRLDGWFRHDGRLDLLALAVTIGLAVVLLRCLPDGPPDLAAVRPTLAATLAWLVCSPQQRPWFDAMIFPLLALMPVTSLDWVVVARGAIGAAAELPGLAIFSRRPVWLRHTMHFQVLYEAPIALTVVALVLVWLCLTGRLRASPTGAPTDTPPDDTDGPDQERVSAARRRSSVQSSPT